MLPEGFDMRREEGKNITELMVYPAKVATFLQIHNLIAKVDKEDLDKIVVSQERAYDAEAPDIMAKYEGVIIDIICHGLHNRRGPYPAYMPEFIRANCTWRDLHVILNSILSRLGQMAFIESTTALTRVGPGAAEMIALQKNLQTWRQN